MGKKLVSARTAHVVPKTKKKAKNKGRKSLSHKGEALPGEKIPSTIKPDNVRHLEDFECLLDDAIRPMGNKK